MATSAWLSIPLAFDLPPMFSVSDTSGGILKPAIRRSGHVYANHVSIAGNAGKLQHVRVNADGVEAIHVNRNEILGHGVIANERHASHAIARYRDDRPGSRRVVRRIQCAVFVVDQRLPVPGAILRVDGGG